MTETASSQRVKQIPTNYVEFERPTFTKTCLTGVNPPNNQLRIRGMQYPSIIYLSTRALSCTDYSLEGGSIRFPPAPCQRCRAQQAVTDNMRSRQLLREDSKWLMSSTHLKPNDSLVQALRTNVHHRTSIPLHEPQKPTSCGRSSNALCAKTDY